MRKFMQMHEAFHKLKCIKNQSPCSGTFPFECGDTTTNFLLEVVVLDVVTLTKPARCVRCFGRVSSLGRGIEVVSRESLWASGTLVKTSRWLDLHLLHGNGPRGGWMWGLMSSVSRLLVNSSPVFLCCRFPYTSWQLCVECTFLSFALSFQPLTLSFSMVVLSQGYFQTTNSTATAAAVLGTCYKGGNCEKNCASNCEKNMWCRVRPNYSKTNGWWMFIN